MSIVNPQGIFFVIFTMFNILWTALPHRVNCYFSKQTETSANRLNWDAGCSPKRVKYYTKNLIQFPYQVEFEATRFDRVPHKGLNIWMRSAHKYWRMLAATKRYYNAVNCLWLTRNGEITLCTPFVTFPEPAAPPSLATWP